VRFFGLLTLLLLFAYGTVVAASAYVGVPGAGWGRGAEDAFEPAEEQNETEAQLSLANVDDDDDDDDDQEVVAAASLVVPWRSVVAFRAVPDPETIRPSLGHPRGIDDPPRS
jgi:hypothetical protein